MMNGFEISPTEMKRATKLFILEGGSHYISSFSSLSSNNYDHMGLRQATVRLCPL